MTQSNTKEWFAIELTVDAEAVEAIEFAFNSLDSLGNEVGGFKNAVSDKTNVIGYFNEPPDDDRLQDELHYALRIFGLTEESIRSIKRRTVENADWLSEWKRHWKPSRIGRFMIAAPWHEIDDDDAIIIRIEPNMAFGTGTHETTQLCLGAIDAHYRPGETFLDVGTGTGILAIAAAKTSSSSDSNTRIVACDTDPDSIKIARENAELNNVGDAIMFDLGPISDVTPVFDFVCANLTLDAISPVLEILIKKTKRHLVLSGILATQEAEITSALLEQRVTDADVRRAGEWISVCVSRISPEN